jgi:ADP-ribosylglycohydrolase
MKAWEMERELLENAQPVVLGEEEQTWGLIEKIETDEDNKLKMLWSSRVPGSGAPERLIIGAIQSMDNMGYDTRKAEILIEDGLRAFTNHDMLELNRITARIYYELNRLPRDKDSGYWNYKEYSSWEEYQQGVNFVTYPPYDTTAKDFEQKIKAGWVAQICGGALGTAIEGYTTEKLKKTFGDIRDYVRKPNTFNDDITYELAFLKAFEKRGYAVTSREIAEEWVALIPFGWSAEDVALRNLKCGVFPPESGLLNNPFREWIGAQMRGAICGMVAPGNPQEAARLAWMDGVISHYNNGVIGEVFNAIMVSLAFVENNVRTILEKAIAMIPKDSEYYAVVSDACARCLAEKSWEDAWRECEKRYSRYNWIHAYPNAAAEVIALWFGKGDFDETMHIISMEGQDVDCNAAQIGTVIGIMHGINGINHRWTEPIGDDLITYVRGYKRIKISELSKWTSASVIKNITRAEASGLSQK